LVDLEVYETIRKWLTKLEAKNRGLDFNKSSTKRAGLYWLGKYLKFLSTTPERPTNPDALIVERLKQLENSNLQTKRKQEEFFEEWIVQLKRKPYAPNSMATATGLVRSFYKANHGPLSEVTPIRAYNIRSFKVPTVKDLKKMCDIADLPLKTFILCAKDSGLPTGDLLSLSLNTLSSEYGTIKSQLKKGINPVHIEMRRGKTKERIDSFFGSNAIEALKEYANLKGGINASRIFRSPSNPTKPMSIRSIEQQVKSLASKAKVATKEVPITPYKLRVFFNTYMKLAGVNESIVERWMGHSIGKVRSAYLVMGKDDQAEGIPISVLAKTYLGAYNAIDIDNA
jgi:integrase